jgi:UDP-glucose 4-epimerase
MSNGETQRCHSFDGAKAKASDGFSECGIVQSVGEQIAVTGATGWIGREICDWFESRGVAVRRLGRKGNRPDVTQLDLNSEFTDTLWEKAIRGYSAVVHCGGHVHRNIETPEECRLFAAVNVEGTRRLLKTCKRVGVERLVFVSSSAVYDWRFGLPANETTFVRPATAYAASKLEAERLVRESGLDWRIARLATVYGLGDQANFARLAGALSRRRFVIPGDGTWRKSVLPVTRAAELIGRLMLLGDEAQRIILNLAAPSAPSLTEICDAFSQACGFPPARHVPLSGLRVAALLGDGLKSLRLPFPLTSETLLKLTTSTVLDVSRMQALFPDIPWVTFAQSLEADAHYYRRL